MKQDQARKLVSQAVIVGAVCIGAPALIVGPLKHRTAGMEQALATAQREASSAVDSQQAARIRLDDARLAGARAEALTARSRASADAAAVYERVMALGAGHGVRIDRMQPARALLSRAASARAAAAAGAAETIGFTISAIGDYDSLAGFIDAIERDAGFSAVEAIRMTPLVTADRDLIQAVLDTRHRAFPAVAARPLAALMEDALTEDAQ